MTLSGKHVLVTGAGGSIASELCKRIAPDVAHLTMLGLTESALYGLGRKLGKAPNLTYRLGSVTDVQVCEEACKDVDVVIHAAAHKHVPICEENVCEAILNNVGGTDTLLRVAAYMGAERFLLISTDKAVRPSSVMGATKRVAERIVSTHPGPIVTQVVRFGNVMDTAGSVLPLWRDQIRSGGPLTLTDPACERYFMRIEEAVSLILSALTLDRGTYVFDMGEPKRLGELAWEVMREVGQEVRVEFVGLRPGEKLTEELHHGGELLATERDKVFRIADPTPAITYKESSRLLFLAYTRRLEMARSRLFELAEVESETVRRAA